MYCCMPIVAMRTPYNRNGLSSALPRRAAQHLAVVHVQIVLATVLVHLLGSYFCFLFVCCRRCRRYEIAFKDNLAKSYEQPKHTQIRRRGQHQKAKTTHIEYGPSARAGGRSAPSRIDQCHGWKYASEIT